MVEMQDVWRWSFMLRILVPRDLFTSHPFRKSLSAICFLSWDQGTGCCGNRGILTVPLEDQAGAR